MKNVLLTISFIVLYAVSSAQTWSVNGITVAGGNGAGSNAKQVKNPGGIFVDSAKNIYVVDRGNHRVQKWMAPDYTTGLIVAGGNGAGNNANQLNTPFDVYVDDNGNVYVSDHMNYRVQRWSPPYTTGVTVAGGNGNGNAANQLSGAMGIWLDNNQNIYVCDYTNHRVQKWMPPYTTGITVAGTGVSGAGANQFNRPVDVFVDKDSNIFVSDEENHRVQKWAPPYITGITVAGGNGKGSLLNQLDNPGCLFVNPGGNVFVADYNNHRVQQWASPFNSGSTVAGGNGAGPDANQLDNVYGMHMDTEGNVYASDLNNHRVQKFSVSGALHTGQVTQGQFSVYPNPSTGQLYFTTAADAPAAIVILSATGVKVFEGVVENSAVISVELEAGIYIVSYEDKGVVRTEKIVIQ